MLPRSRALLGGGFALGIGVLAALPGTLSASAGTAIPTFRPGHVLFDVGIHSSVSRAQALRAALTVPSFPQYTYSVKVGTHTYKGVIVGKNPSVKVSNPASTVNAELIPVILKFSSTGPTWNPTVKDACDSGATPLARAQASPIVTSVPSWTWGGTKIGAGQVTDAFQRANFWKYAKPTGINPKFGVTLKWTTLSPVTINVPSSWGPAETSATICGSSSLHVGAVNINSLDSYLRKTVIPSLASKGLVSDSTFPVFLAHNFVEYVGTTSECCVLGYHSDYSRGGGVQTYGWTMYDNSSLFTGSFDISGMSHEVAEWQNDPYTNNPTPSWGHIGQVSGCQANLEVGDPLSGTTYKVKVGTFTYHPQQLAFFSWFYHQSPSLGVNGWYSDQGKFRTFAKACS
jgi:hypothetical protein